MTLEAFTTTIVPSVLTGWVIYALMKSELNRLEFELRLHYMPSEEFDEWNKNRLARKKRKFRFFQKKRN